MRLTQYAALLATGVAMIRGTARRLRRTSQRSPAACAAPTERRWAASRSPRRPANSTITTTVTTDDAGRYAFPADRLGPGDYALTIRAVGFDLDGKPAATVAAEHTATADIKLKKTKNLSRRSSPAPNGSRAGPAPTPRSGSSPTA